MENKFFILLCQKFMCKWVTSYFIHTPELIINQQYVTAEKGIKWLQGIDLLCSLCLLIVHCSGHSLRVLCVTIVIRKHCGWLSASLFAAVWSVTSRPLVDLKCYLFSFFSKLCDSWDVSRVLHFSFSESLVLTK